MSPLQPRNDLNNDCPRDCQKRCYKMRDIAERRWQHLLPISEEERLGWLGDKRWWCSRRGALPFQAGAIKSHRIMLAALPASRYYSLIVACTGFVSYCGRSCGGQNRQGNCGCDDAGIGIRTFEVATNGQARHLYGKSALH